MVSALSVTLNMPNIGLSIYYLVCIILVPGILVNTGKSELLRFYLPLLLPIANVLQESGNPNMYQNLLILEEANPISIISSFIIHCLTVLGILWFSINIAMKNSNLGDGIMVGLLTFVVIFGFSRVIIPDLIEKGDRLIKEHTDFKPAYNMHKYIVGFLLVVLICLLNLGLQNIYTLDQGEIIRRQVKF